MARAPRGSRRRALDRLRRGSAHSAAGRNIPPQRCTWTGVRERAPGGRRWAAQVRIPGTRARLWIGRFEQALEAALAYDAALFCLYGAARLPSPRRFNLPAAPRPAVPEHVRATLTAADIKRIAASHGRNIANFYVGPLPAAAAVAPAAAAAAAPPPPPPAAAASDAASAVAGGEEEATAATTDDGSSGGSN